MKSSITRSSIIKIFFLLLILTENAAYSEERADSLKYNPGFFAGINIGASQNRITYKGIGSIINITSKSKFSMPVNFGFEFGYFLSRSTGISTGIGYSSYNAELLLNSYTNSFTTTDSENETYEKRVSGSGIKEVQNISFLSIPVCLNFQLPANKAFGFYLKVGVNLSIPVKQQYISSGTFTYTGYYPAYNIVFNDLPEYGFPTDIAISTDDKLDLNSLIIEGLADAGFQYTIKNKFQIKLGASFSRSLSTISQYPSPSSYQLSTDPDRINSLMGGSKSGIAESIGLRLSFRYFIK